MKLIRFFGFVIRDGLLAWAIFGCLLMFTGGSHPFSTSVGMIPFAASISLGGRIAVALLSGGSSKKQESGGMSDSDERRILDLGEKIARNGLRKAENPSFRCERCQNSEENNAGYFTCGHQGFMVLATQTCDEHSNR